MVKRDVLQSQSLEMSRCTILQGGESYMKCHLKNEIKFKAFLYVVQDCSLCFVFLFFLFFNLKFIVVSKMLVKGLTV